MSTLDSAAVWSATSLALDETKITAAGLSVRQRKLLALLSEPASLPQLSQRIALPVDDVQVALERFAKLGFAQSSEAVPMSPMATQLRSPSVVEAPSRTPMLIGVAVAVVAAIGAGVWLLRGGSTISASAPVASAIGNTPVPTATGPGDSADSGLSGAAAKAAAAAPASAATANTAAAATGRPVVPQPATAPAPATAATVAGAAVPAPTKAGTPATVAPTTASPSVAPTVAAPATNNAPALTLATTLPSVPTVASAAAPAVVAATPAASVAPAVQTAAPATEVAAATAATAASASTATAARAAPAASRESKLVNRVEPAFPRGFDADKGTVRARLQVDARGAVTSVDIVEASPPRVFDRTVRSALQQWRYEPTGEAFTVIAEINFSR